MQYSRSECISLTYATGKMCAKKLAIKYLRVFGFYILNCNKDYVYVITFLDFKVSETDFLVCFYFAKFVTSKIQ